MCTILDLVCMYVLPCRSLIFTLIFVWSSIFLSFSFSSHWTCLPFSSPACLLCYFLVVSCIFSCLVSCLFLLFFLRFFFRFSPNTLPTYTPPSCRLQRTERPTEVGPTLLRLNSCGVSRAVAWCGTPQPNWKGCPALRKPHHRRSRGGVEN